jgi:basic membrane lipoprotein Med (substrate-binding protein (PBP1-ABC) superfamily)
MRSMGPRPGASALVERAEESMGEQSEQRGGLSRRSVLKYGGLGFAGLIAGPTVLAACGDDDDGGSGGAANGTVNVAFAYIGPINDNGWTTTHDLGRLAVEKKFGSQVKTTYVENVPISAEASQTFEKLAKENDLVIVNTEYANFLSDVSKKYPKVKFIEADGHTYTDNLYPYYVSHHKAAYLIGVAAGALSKSGKLGYIGAFPTATAYNDVNPLLLGARTVNSKATVQAIMISSFFDPQKATQAANALIDGGVDFIFAVMDEPSFLQVADKRGVWAATWNKDVREFGPNAYVTTYALNWDSYYVEQVQAVIDGKWKSQKEVRLLPLDIGPFGAKVPTDVQVKVADAKKKIDGGFNPYTGPLKDDKGNEKLAAGKTISDVDAYAIDWAVEGVSGVK